MATAAATGKDVMDLSVWSGTVPLCRSATTVVKTRTKAIIMGLSAAGAALTTKTLEIRRPLRSWVLNFPAE